MKNNSKSNNNNKLIFINSNRKKKIIKNKNKSLDLKSNKSELKNKNKSKFIQINEISKSKKKKYSKQFKIKRKKIIEKNTVNQINFEYKFKDINTIKQEKKRSSFFIKSKFFNVERKNSFKLKKLSSKSININNPLNNMNDNFDENSNKNYLENIFKIKSKINSNLKKILSSSNIFEPQNKKKEIVLFKNNKKYIKILKDFNLNNDELKTIFYTYDKFQIKKIKFNFKKNVNKVFHIFDKNKNSEDKKRRIKFGGNILKIFIGIENKLIYTMSFIDNNDKFYELIKLKNKEKINYNTTQINNHFKIIGFKSYYDLDNNLCKFKCIIIER